MKIPSFLKNFLRKKLFADKGKFVISTIHMDKLSAIRSMTAKLPRAITDYELLNLYLFSEKTSLLEGDVAEVGVWKGCSAKVIGSVKGNRKLVLFDTFSGLPRPGIVDTRFHEGQFSDTSLDEVKRNMGAIPDVEYAQGIFPQTTVSLQNRPAQCAIVKL